MSTLYIDRKGIQLKLDGGSIAFYENHERVGAVPLAPIERVVMRGDVQLAANILGDLGERGIGVLILSGRKSKPTMLMAKPHNDASRRIAQYRLSLDEKFCVGFTQCILQLKLQGQLSLLQKLRETYLQSRYPLKLAIDTVQNCINNIDNTHTIPSLRGIEGAAAASYFGGFADCLAARLKFTGRNRQPPKDPLNAILSLGYTLLHAEAVVALYSAGLDPYIGFYHGLDFGRESLACDLIEPLRPQFDRMAIEWFQKQELRIEDFSQTEQGCLMGKAGRTRFYTLFEQQAEQYRQQLTQDVRELIDNLKKFGLNDQIRIQTRKNAIIQKDD
jgi:CRISPR-associated protein Cas1